MLLDKETADFIIFLIKAYQERSQSPHATLPSYSVKGSAKYLLGQIIRQINIPHTHMYVSENALNLWQTITNDNIKEKYFNKCVTCKINWDDRPKYIGANKIAESAQTYCGKTFKYNEVFLDEHIVPVAVIIKELLKLNVNNDNIYQQIDSIISNLNMCKMLKSENPKNKFKRSIHLTEVLQTDYAKIKILNFNQIDATGNFIRTKE